MNTPIKIILAEDNATLSLILRYKLEKEGYEIIVANNGKETIELIQQHNPDLILTDIMMPFISGLEVISFVRNKLKKQTPILAFSSARQEDIVLKAFRLGVSDFMSKPLSPKELIVRVKILLNSIPKPKIQNTL